jgi:hypothetical protein
MNGLTEIGTTEEVALFNPAFLARLLHGTTHEYEKSSGTGFPVPLAFLSVTVSLHKPTRNDLPRTSAALMQKWIREHPRHLAQLSSRVVGLRPFTGMAMRFGIGHGVLTSNEGLLHAGTLLRRPRNLSSFETDEIGECLKAARFLGRWFARQPDAATALAWWGLAP